MDAFVGDGVFGSEGLGEEVDPELLDHPAHLACRVGVALGGLQRDQGVVPVGGDGLDLVRGPLGLYDDGTPPPGRPGRSTRIGLAAGKGERARLRWFVRNDQNVSGPRSSSRRTAR